MSTQSPQNRRTQTAQGAKVTRDLRHERRPLKIVREAYHSGAQSIFRRLGRPSQNGRPTEAQRNLVLTSFILGCASIFTAVFPICGLPIAITGLLLGLYSRQTTPLRIMSSWAIVLSLVGLFITLVYTVVTISIYFSSYLFSS